MVCRTLFSLLLPLILALPVLARADLGNLPQLQAEDLNEKPWLLPNDLQHEHTLLLIAFKREQQADLDTWIEGLGLKQSDLPWLELPVLEDYGSWFKWFVDNGMRRGIKSEFDRAKVVTVYTNKTSFNDQMKLSSEDTVYAVVVNQEGEVIARETGRYTPEGAERLQAWLTESGQQR